MNTVSNIKTNIKEQIKLAKAIIEETEGPEGAVVLASDDSEKLAKLVLTLFGQLICERCEYVIKMNKIIHHLCDNCFENTMI